LHENDPWLIQQAHWPGRAPSSSNRLPSEPAQHAAPVHELERARQEPGGSDAIKVEERRPLRSLAVFSPARGVGSTTVLKLAVALYEDTGARVLLMEGKFFFGHSGRDAQHPGAQQRSPTYCSCQLPGREPGA